MALKLTSRLFRDPTCLLVTWFFLMGFLMVGLRSLTEKSASASRCDIPRTSLNSCGTGRFIVGAAIIHGGVLPTQLHSSLVQPCRYYHTPRRAEKRSSLAPEKALRSTCWRSLTKELSESSEIGRAHV